MCSMRIYVKVAIRLIPWFRSCHRMAALADELIKYQLGVFLRCVIGGLSLRLS